MTIEGSAPEPDEACPGGDRPGDGLPGLDPGREHDRDSGERIVGPEPGPKRKGGDHGRKQEDQRAIEEP